MKMQDFSIGQKLDLLGDYSYLRPSAILNSGNSYCPSSRTHSCSVLRCKCTFSPLGKDYFYLSPGVMLNSLNLSWGGLGRGGQSWGGALDSVYFPIYQKYSPLGEAWKDTLLLPPPPTPGKNKTYAQQR